MSKPLSVDLRERVVVAAVDGGLSRRKAAERFGVSISSAIRWTAQVRRTGDVQPRRVGGDKRSGRIEVHAGVILAAVEEKPGITLAELRERLMSWGVAVAVSTLWRFFARKKITLKKRMAHPVCKGDLGMACWSASTYPVSRRCSPGQDGSRASRAS